MPNNRKPTVILEAKGAFKKNPNRARPHEPKQSDPLGDPPNSLRRRQERAWIEIVENVPAGVLKKADRHAVELAAKLLAESRSNWTNFPVSKIAQLQRLLASFGMTPADRSRIVIEKSTEDSNEFGL